MIYVYILNAPNTVSCYHASWLEYALASDQFVIPDRPITLRLLVYHILITFCIFHLLWSEFLTPFCPLHFPGWHLRHVFYFCAVIGRAKKELRFPLAEKFKKLSNSVGYNLINFLMRTKRTHKVQPNSHKCLGSEVKSINLSTQNKNVKQNFQRSGFCSEFNSWQEIREGRWVRKSFLKDGVDKRKIEKEISFFMLLLVRLGLEPSLCSPKMYVYVY